MKKKSKITKREWMNRSPGLRMILLILGVASISLFVKPLSAFETITFAGVMFFDFVYEFCKEL